MTSITWGPFAMSQMQQAWQAHKAAQAKAAADAAEFAQSQLALAYQMPQAQLMYSEDPTETTALLKTGAFSQALERQNSQYQFADPHIPVLRAIPFQQRDLLNPVILSTSSDAALYIGGRLNPQTKQTRIVIVTLAADFYPHDVQRGDGSSVFSVEFGRHFTFSVVAPAGPQQDRSLLWQLFFEFVQAPEHELVQTLGPQTRLIQQPDCLRLLAGRADLKRPNALLIDYTLDGHPGTIEADLTPADQIELKLPGGALPTMVVFSSSFARVEWDPHR